MKFQTVEFGKKDVCVKRTAWATGKIHIIFAKGKSSGLAGKKKVVKARYQTIHVLNRL